MIEIRLVYHEVVNKHMKMCECVHFFEQMAQPSR